MIKIDRGARYNRLTLIDHINYRSTDNRQLGLWRCDCGTQKVLPLSRVTRDCPRSCGCLVVDNHPRTHGMRYSREYSSWIAMLGRCRNPSHKDYPKYGARGIMVCDEWAASFASFYTHVGPRPKGTTLDRIDGTGHYKPGNVRWATPKQQARNRKGFVVVNTPAGIMPLVDYAKRIGLSRGAAHLRLKRGKLEGVSYV